MIYYFSGTGNSKFIAETMANHLEDTPISIIGAKAHLDHSLGFIFPIYAWGVPRIMLDFIDTLPNNDSVTEYAYAIATCGENVGKAMDILKKALLKKGIHLSLAYSLVMPNNYIISGDIDSLEDQKKKLNIAVETTKKIAKHIEVKSENHFDVVEGPVPMLLTYVVHPLFSKYGTSAKPFKASEKCTQCKLCQVSCPTQNISVDIKPKWADNCTGCLCCIHICPVKAINYGSKTQNKGRYHVKYLDDTYLSNK